MVEVALPHSRAGLDVAQAFATSQLREGHAKVLVETWAVGLEVAHLGLGGVIKMGPDLLARYWLASGDEGERVGHVRSFRSFMIKSPHPRPWFRVP